MSRRALIFRSDLLPPSETFIVAQAAALRRYRPVFVGLRACRSAHTPPLDPVLPSRFANRYGQLIFQRTGFAPGLLAAAKAHDCSLLHAHFAIDAAEALPLVRSLQLPLAVTLHGYDVMRSDEAHRRTRQGRLYLARRQELWSEAAVFICVSNAIRERALFCGYPVEKLRILPIGIDTNALLPARPRLAIEPTILFVGRLVPKKGCHVLIEAMARVQQVLPAARLVIAGDGPERSRLQTAAERRTNATRFLGPQTRDRVHVLMRSARCLAAPSLTAADGDSEGLPTVLCEALALGLPVASTFHS